MIRERDLAVGCGPGMPGPYKRPEGLRKRNVGGGVPDAPQVSSLSRVMRRAASPLAAAKGLRRREVAREG